MEPIEPPRQAITVWISDDEPDPDWFNRPRNPANPDPDGLDQRQPWFANPPDPPAEFKKHRCQKKSWQSGYESYARGT
jgi:hypothetical protein